MTLPAWSQAGPGTNTGHGHVWPRPDGVKARCGGPGMCRVCSQDLARTLEATTPTPPSPDPGVAAVAWPDRMVNVPAPNEDGWRIVGFKVRDDDPIMGKYGLTEPLDWLRSVTKERAPTPPSAPHTGEAVREIVENLRKTRDDLAEHRTTHVVWRDWLNKDPANAAVNPHAGSAEFHAGCVADYDRHLANIDAAIKALADWLNGGDNNV